MYLKSLANRMILYIYILIILAEMLTFRLRPGSENLTIVEREFYIVRIGRF